MIGNTHINTLKTWIIQLTVSPLKDDYGLRKQLFVVKKLERTNFRIICRLFFFIMKGDCNTNREKRQHPKLKRLKSGKRERSIAQTLWYLPLSQIHWCSEREQAGLLRDVKTTDRIWRTPQKLSGSMKI